MHFYVTFRRRHCCRKNVSQQSTKTFVQSSRHRTHLTFIVYEGFEFHHFFLLPSGPTRLFNCGLLLLPLLHFINHQLSHAGSKFITILIIFLGSLCIIEGLYIPILHLITETMRVEQTDRLAATSKKEWTAIEQGKERMGVHRVLLYL